MRFLSLLAFVFSISLPRIAAGQTVIVGNLTIQVLSGSAIVYGATIDNRTNDPSMQIARRTP